MSLYTPVFPSSLQSNTSPKGPPENAVTNAPEKQENYVDLLRNVHLFLSTQGDTLSPPSRPNSPLFDHRVQRVRDQVRNIFNAAEGNTSNGMWTRVSQTLKLGCVRGRYWSASEAAPCPPEDTNWILPEEESEWIEWEKKREESRRLKGKTNVSQQIDTAATAVPGSQKSNRATSTKSSHVARERHPRDVSPATLRAAKEKVKKWQASVASGVWHDSTHGLSPSSSKAVVTADPAKGKTERPQRSHTLDFAVVKPAARLIIGKKGGDPLSRLGVRGGSAPIPSQKSKSLTPSKAADSPVGADDTAARRPPKTSPVKDDTPKISDMPETPYLPPSFPAHLETSTPLPNSVIVIRAKPSPILPITALSSTPLPSTSIAPPDGSRYQFIIAEPHATDTPSCLPPQPPQIDTVQPGKRIRSPAASLGRIPNDPLVTPPAKKRLRGLSQDRSVPSDEFSKPMSSNRGFDIVPCTRDPRPGPVPSHPTNMDTVGIAAGGPLTPRKGDQPLTGVDAQGCSEKIPSPTKSVKSYFSAPDSDIGDLPLKANLLLESPVSPMLSYAQNASGFLPQFTSTQTGKGSPSAGQTNNGLGMGYSSQFDIERHVDRVSELLEKEVDFDGWLRDVRTVEMGQD